MGRVRPRRRKTTEPGTRPRTMRETYEECGHAIRKDVLPADDAFEDAIATLQVAWRHSGQGRRTSFERAAWRHLIDVAVCKSACGLDADRRRKHPNILHVTGVKVRR